MATIKAVFRLFLLALLSLAVAISQTIILTFYRGPASYLIPILWENGARMIFGIKLTVEGKPERRRHVIYVSNHLSYGDVPVLGSVIPFASFVARGDLEKWPVWGYLGKMQQTIYISRSRQDTFKEKSSLDRMLAEHKNLIIFAEGTSSDGSRVLPFKSSLFSLALNNPTGKPLMVQAVTISLLEVDGKPAVDGPTRDLYAWHGDMDLVPHMWRLAKSRGAKIKVTFHPPRDATAYADRKPLCADCYNDVCRGLASPTETLASAA